VGTFVGPFIGAVLFLEGLDVNDGALVSAETRNNALLGIDQAYFWLAGLIGALGCYFWFVRKLIDSVEPESAPATSFAVTVRDGLGSPWTRIGAIAIFLYVGAEVSIGTMLALFLLSDVIWGSADAPRAIAPLASFMQLDATPGVSLLEAAKAVSFYWGGAMVGRLFGTFLLTRLPAALLLGVCSVSAALLCLFVFTVAGPASGFAALSIGLFNSLMFPTIFSLTLERSSTRPEVTSGVLCTAIIGGAVIPLIAGWFSDRWSYSTAFAVPMICYLAVAVFAALAFRTSPTNVAAAPQLH
jgi:FHS family L-fucose permease-like MFS transporter